MYIYMNSVPIGVGCPKLFVSETKKKKRKLGTLS
jgi:hypothetical protein